MKKSLTKEHAHLPICLPKINDAAVISCYSNYSMFSDQNGNMFSFGSNFKGRLGLEISDEEVSLPK